MCGRAAAPRPRSRSAMPARRIRRRRIPCSRPASARPATHRVSAGADPGGDTTAGATGNDDHGELAWRLRHARRTVLKDATVPQEIVARANAPDEGPFGRQRSGTGHEFIGPPRFELLCDHAVFGTGQPADERLLRYTAAAVLATTSHTTPRICPWARRSESMRTGPCAPDSRRATSRRGSSPASTPLARPLGTGTTSASRTARSATKVGTSRRCVT